MSEIVKIVCLKVRSALLEYRQTGKVPSKLIEGEITLADINQCASNYSTLESSDAEKLSAAYLEYAKKNTASIKSRLRAEYTHALNNQLSRSDDFVFKEILDKYRDGINPVTALCYELKRCSWKYNIDDLYHQWLLDIITDHEFNTKLSIALETDILTFKNIIKKYSILFTVDKEIPLELFHAKQRIKEFESLLKEISKFNIWDE